MDFPRRLTSYKSVLPVIPCVCLSPAPVFQAFLFVLFLLPHSLQLDLDHPVFVFLSSFSHLAHIKNLLFLVITSAFMLLRRGGIIEMSGLFSLCNCSHCDGGGRGRKIGFAGAAKKNGRKGTRLAYAKAGGGYAKKMSFIYGPSPLPGYIYVCVLTPHYPPKGFGMEIKGFIRSFLKSLELNWKIRSGPHRNRVLILFSKYLGLN